MIRLRTKIYSLAGILVIFLVKILSWPPDGLKLTPDSSAYLAAAQTLIDTGTFGTSFLHWPPLYPLALSFTSLFESDLLIAAGYLNATIFFILLLGYWHALATSLSSDKIISIGLILVAFSQPIDHIFSYVWSEPLFLLTSFYCLYFWARFLAHQKSVDLTAACVLLMMCMLSRHIGFVVPIVMLFSIALYFPSFCIKSLARIFTAGLLALVPYIFWLYRTWDISATLTGPRITEKDANLLDSLAQFSNSVAHWSFPHSYFIDSAHVAASITATIMTIILTATIALSVYSRRNIRKNEAPNIDNSGSVPVVIFGWFTLFYSSILILSVSLFKVDPIGYRLISPLIFPLTYVLLYCATLLVSYVDIRHAKITRLLIITGSIWFLIWIAAPNQLNGLLLMQVHP